MATTISNGTTTLTALFVESFTSSREANNVIHRIIGTTTPAVVYRQAALRSGKLRIAVQTRAQAEAMSALHAGTHSLVLQDGEVPEVAMTYAATGSIDIEMDSATGSFFWVSTGFEVVA